MFKKLLVIAVFASGVATLGQARPIEAQAVPTYTYFCHATNSATNPYVKVPFSQTYSEIDGQGNNDHSLHTGPVATSVAHATQLKSQKIDWGDVIPPVPSVLPAGYNWTNDGQAIWQNDCDYPEDSPVAFCDALTFLQVTENEVQFTASAVAQNGPTIQSYNFDFGDGNTTGEVAGNQVNHTYTDSGTYNANVTVTFMDVRQQTFTDMCETTVTITDDGEILGSSTPQVTETPTGAVSAGTGAGAGVKSASLLGLVGSIVALGYGLVRKFNT